MRGYWSTGIRRMAEKSYGSLWYGLVALVSAFVNHSSVAELLEVTNHDCNEHWARWHR